MLRSLVALLGAVLLSTPAQAQPQPQPPPAGAQPFFPYPLRTTTLPNGLTVVRVPFDSKGLVAYATVVRVGSRNEIEPGLTGFAHFFEHMMFRGTPKYPEGTRDRLLGQLGFNENAFTTNDVTLYHVAGPSAGLEKLIELEADRFKNLAYAEPAFQTEAKAVLGEYHKNATRPERKLDEALRAKAYVAHTYRHTTMGFHEDIKKMPERYAYSKEFFERWYTPDNAIIYVVGDFDDARVLSLVEQHYGDWEGKAAQIQIPVEPPQRGEKSVHLDWPTPTLPRHLHAWHTPSAQLGSLDGGALAVLSAYMAGPTSPLYRDLVLDKQLVESVGVMHYPTRDPALFTLAAVLKDEKHRGAVRDAFNRTVKDIVAGRIDRARFDAVKSNLRYALLMGLETPNDLAINLGYFAGSLGEVDALDRHFQNISRVEPQHLISVVKKHFTAKNRTIVTLRAKETRR